MSKINLFALEDASHRAFDRITPLHDGAIVGCGCDEDDFFVCDDAGRTILSTDEVAAKVENSGSWHAGEVIKLLADRSGVWGTSSPAQLLSNALHTMVIAPAGYLYLWDDGRYIVSEFGDIDSPDDPRIDYEDQERYWFAFYPQD